MNIHVHVQYTYQMTNNNSFSLFSQLKNLKVQSATSRKVNLYLFFHHIPINVLIHVVMKCKLKTYLL